MIFFNFIFLQRGRVKFAEARYRRALLSLDGVFGNSKRTKMDTSWRAKIMLLGKFHFKTNSDSDNMHNLKKNSHVCHHNILSHFPQFHNENKKPNYRFSDTIYCAIPDGSMGPYENLENGSLQRQFASSIRETTIS